MLFYAQLSDEVKRVNAHPKAYHDVKHSQANHCKATGGKRKEKQDKGWTQQKNRSESMRVSKREEEGKAMVLWLTTVVEVIAVDAH